MQNCARRRANPTNSQHCEGNIVNAAVSIARRPIVAISILCGVPFGAVHAQQAPAPATPQVEEVVVTGSRIAQDSARPEQPVSVIDHAAIERTGLAGVGELLQQLTTSGKALNAKFNSSGNFGYPADGGGIGAGSAQVDLRSLESKRVLVLVDGVRWVNESSASGVSGSADLNTIPMSIVDRIEVLEDGASAIYGSDAIGGVVNIITRSKFEGVELNGYVGDWSRGGQTTQGSVTVGGSGDRFSGMFVASYYDQNAIRSGEWEQSAFPEPLAGLSAGSSGTVQGRMRFCDPSRPAGSLGSCDKHYDVTLNEGTTTPAWNPANPAAGTYHAFSDSDRFNYAPYNFLLTPSNRKAFFTNITFAASDDVELYAKGLFNNRKSANEAAPEPIFVGPVSGTGGIADTISISRLNPFNPFGIDLDASSNFDGIGRRPVEAGPRIFKQDVDTWYFAGGVRGTLHLARDYKWDVNYVNTQNKANQTFTNGYNIAKIGIALGDPAICARITGCTPLDLFGGQGRPMTPAMLNYILAPQIDSSEQTLKLFSASFTGELFSIGGDRKVGFAVGAEHRVYDGRFTPDPLRQTGESQDSFAAPVAASYNVSEAYTELGVPVLDSLRLSAAARYSDYSTFGNKTTYKGGFRWQPVRDFALRGTYSTGFRAPNLGELFGLTQFGATLTDPCGPTGHPVVAGGPNPSALEVACRAQGVPVGFQQANPQIITFTGGNAELQPEESRSYTGGIVYRAGWAEGRTGIDQLAFEFTYYKHKISGAVQARDLVALLNSCLAGGGTAGPTCAPFHRISSGDLAPPQNFLDNLGEIRTDGVDAKINWNSGQLSFGHLSAAIQATRVNDYKAVDIDGNVARRQVGVEVNNSAIPRIRANAQLGWGVRGIEVSWGLRYLSSVTESCGDAIVTPVPGCANETTLHDLGSVLYHDVQLSWTNPFSVKGLSVELGVNNVFGKEPPLCFSCTLNGYDAGTYDLPGAFWNARAKFAF
jgi:iron complex outermembrane receptor protein